jgi:hypothetical protein
VLHALPFSLKYNVTRLSGDSDVRLSEFTLYLVSYHSGVSLCDFSYVV